MHNRLSDLLSSSMELLVGYVVSGGASGTLGKYLLEMESLIVIRELGSPELECEGTVTDSIEGELQFDRSLDNDSFSFRSSKFSSRRCSITSVWFEIRSFCARSRFLICSFRRCPRELLIICFLRSCWKLTKYPLSISVVFSPFSIFIPSACLRHVPFLVVCKVCTSVLAEKLHSPGI